MQAKLTYQTKIALPHGFSTRQIIISGLIFAVGVTAMLLGSKIVYSRISALDARPTETVSEPAEQLSFEGYVGPLTQGFVANLRSAGLSASIISSVHRSFFAEEGRLVALGGDNVQVFEYTDTALALSDVSNFEKSANTRQGAWKKNAHLYSSDKLLLLYTGQRQSIIESLEAIFGLEISFAGQGLRV